MKGKGQVGAKVGFTNPADGWHRVVVQEGLSLKVNETSGKESFMVPFAIDTDDEDAGKRVTLFINTRNEKGEQYKKMDDNFANLLANLKLLDKFEATFPGDVSWIEPKVIELMKIKLIGTFCYLKLETDKNGRQNITELQTVDFKPPVETKKVPTAAPATSGAAAAAVNW